ncbi:Phosphotyrosyl phosphatase activator [Vararia minispora EC-137]|uniref:Phosphotyrosyl phosphatase activator n=1 Tax=Vararia minispora EC-137 TaxID=1314806 RepID=A0ACB8Q8D5_9AGAM|nr:Phosphotyrosyl phosphatase activator [Vararia minispora EC-137]
MATAAATPSFPPAPTVEPLPPSTGPFRRPAKALLTREQLDAFPGTRTYGALMGYIETLNAAVRGVRLSDPCEQSAGVEAALKIIARVEAITHDTPPVDNSSSRFGNPAFRTFYDRVQSESHAIHESLPGLPADAIEEVSAYFEECWGNRSRIDYGSGMELNFLCWMFCLERLGVFTHGDHVALVTRVFWRYIEVMRVLQSTYWLEPAGSHGVWGLDDYHFLPFLFGSSQLAPHRHLRPKSIHDPDVVDEFAREYMYLACIRFINSVKTASLRWHSPMLDDISVVKTWDKVNQGMLKMYRAEVLGKLPVVQHFLFGSILSWEGPLPPPQSGVDASDPHAGHAHGPGTGWGDCCGIPVPSAFGAAAAEKDKRSGLAGPGIRPVPFD